MVDSPQAECCSASEPMVEADAPVDELPVSIDDALSTPLPPDVGAAVASAYGTEERPATFGDWLDGMAAAYAATDVDSEPEDMCAVEESRHVVERGGETTAYVCVLDPLAIPFIEGRSAHVRSDPPVGEGTIEFRIGPDDVTVDPAEAVVSFGVDAPPPDAPLSVEETYDRLCPYGHAFPEEAAYERWDGDVEGIVTTVIDAETAVGVAAGIARRCL